MWLSAIKIAVQAGSKIYSNRQKAKIAMSEAQLLHAEKQAKGEEAYQGKLLEARQNDYKDEVVLFIQRCKTKLIVIVLSLFEFSKCICLNLTEFKLISKHANPNEINKLPQV